MCLRDLHPHDEAHGSGPSAHDVPSCDLCGADTNELACRRCRIRFYASCLAAGHVLGVDCMCPNIAPRETESQYVHVWVPTTTALLHSVQFPKAPALTASFAHALAAEGTMDCHGREGLSTTS